MIWKTRAAALALLALAGCDQSRFPPPAPTPQTPGAGPPERSASVPSASPPSAAPLASAPPPDPSRPAPRDAGTGDGCAAPARVIKVGELPGIETTWTPGDVLSDYQNGRSWYAPTLSPVAYQAPRGSAFRDEDPSRFRFVPGPDGASVDVVEAASGKPITGKAPFVIAAGSLAVDARGRVFDLARKGYADERPFRCHPTERPFYDLSLTGRFLVCDARGRGLAVRDRVHGWEASLGDGKLTLSPDDRFGLLLPGPFEGRSGHVETVRRGVDRVRFGPSGVADLKPVGPAGSSVALSAKGAYAILSGKDLTVHRACDDAVIGRIEVLVKDPRVAFGSSGSLLAVMSGERTIVYRME